MNQQGAENLLRQALNNPIATFREGQWEAINALVNERRKLLVVQRTGWGKSSVYFISTKILRDRGQGVTVIISPLLALMRNQIDAAKNLGVNAITLNSTNKDEWGNLTQQVMANQVDCLLISPERLANEDFLNTLLLPIAEKIALFVVDEAHCISDWGHDFRPDYRRLLNILKQMPSNMPVLGTTATANNRVIEDTNEQLGGVEVIRGTLDRESLALQTIQLKDQTSRLVWLSSNIPKFDYSGIVYVLTKRDANQVTKWLKLKGISAHAYYSGVTDERFDDSDSYRQYLENALINNEIKVLVATTALGMGYDKPDLGFVIHYQVPNSVVSYYQQVGRAGRAIDHAYGILLAGEEDYRIHEFFRTRAFPSEYQVNLILSELENSNGLSIVDLQQQLNLRKGQIDDVLKFLNVYNPAPVIKIGSKWKRTPVHFQMDHARIEHLTGQREDEWEEIQSYVETKQCLMDYLRNSLDDELSEPCGQCANCIGEPIVDISIDHQTAIEASQFLKHSEMDFKPKIQVGSKTAFPVYEFPYNLPVGIRASEGRILSRWGDAGWGQVVEHDKHANHFSDELVEATAEMIESRWNPSPKPQWVTCVPSLNHTTLVPDYAQRLAKRLGIPFINLVTKVKHNEAQKLQQNRFHQCSNLDGVFEIQQGVQDTPVFLVDDIIDSGWTVTVIAALLRQQGSGEVFPVALASTSSGDE
ncbi:MAG: RecQ family ATP-dependent DNA helicase [Gammaproteobacteria bacterium]|jgi:ATP-dependent DNA helicase RecQ|nr:RecQ family ATP-dependent DNA helicase [Gammaproteobacteria bacterium]MBT7209301.1 RecQ family ATP-dependent DNA helicase [Gammaproteobacteria bacterium]